MAPTRPEDEESFLHTLFAKDDKETQDASERLTDDEAVTLSYLEHVVLPADTFHGVCLRYRISATELRRANCFSGTNLALAPAKLRIPVRQQQDAVVTPQDTNTPAYKVQSLLIQFPAFQESEARNILESHGWNLEAAVQFLLSHCSVTASEA